jgi:hypothetical protein
MEVLRKSRRVNGFMAGLRWRQKVSFLAKMVAPLGVPVGGGLGAGLVVAEGMRLLVLLVVAWVAIQ